jgi:polyhydroxyalkanoate synthesis repressor PhaR
VSKSSKETVDEAGNADPILIKKYPNRRLYNTATSSYIVLDDIVDLINSDIPFVIHDKKSGEDITRSILNQIIFEREVKPNDYHFSLELQKQLISMYSDSYSHMVPKYLTESMQLFAAEKDRMSEVLGDMVSKNTQAMMDFGQNMTRQNIELFNKSWQMFSPTEEKDSTATSKSKDSASNQDTERANLEEELTAMKAEIEKLQKRLKSLK